MGGNDIKVVELNYIGYGTKIINKTKQATWGDLVKKPARDVVYICENEKELKNIDFSFAIILKGDRFVKYVYPQITAFKSPYKEKEITPDNFYNPLNPQVIIQRYENYNVVRDDLLPGGTKQRGLYHFIGEAMKKGYKSFVYGGPAQGVAQAGLGIAAKILGVEAHMFYSGRRSILSKFAEDVGVNMHPVEGTLVMCKKEAENFVAKDPKRLLLPFGLDEDEFKKSLIRALKQSMPPIKIKHMWVVGGTGVLLNCLYHILPETYFHVIQVGRPLVSGMFEPSRTQLFVHPKKFNEVTDYMPPYKSIDNYDAKVWYFVKKYGRPDDFIWNVAG